MFDHKRELIATAAVVDGVVLVILPKVKAAKAAAFAFSPRLFVLRCGC